MSVPVTQYSIIILRDPVEANLPGAPIREVLPGAPSSMSPLVFEPGLEPNEVVATPDTGRMFLGHTPKVGQPNFRRITFPYQNIEVLTENSVDRFNAMVGAYRRNEGDQSFYYAVLAPNAALAPITIALPGDPTHQFRINDVSSVAATFDYAGFNSTGKPVKMGALRILYGTGAGTPVCVDTGNDLGTSLLTFSATVEGPVGSQYMLINYKYTGTGNLTLRFRVSRPTFATGV
jgi:hypothetical protein